VFRPTQTDTQIQTTLKTILIRASGELPVSNYPRNITGSLPINDVFANNLLNLGKY